MKASKVRFLIVTVLILELCLGASLARGQQAASGQAQRDCQIKSRAQLEDSLKIAASGVGVNLLVLALDLPTKKLTKAIVYPMTAFSVARVTDFYHQLSKEGQCFQVCSEKSFASWLGLGDTMTIAKVPSEHCSFRRVDPPFQFSTYRNELDTIVRRSYIQGIPDQPPPPGYSSWAALMSGPGQKRDVASSGPSPTSSLLQGLADSSRGTVPAKSRLLELLEQSNPNSSPHSSDRRTQSMLRSSLFAGAVAATATLSGKVMKLDLTSTRLDPLPDVLVEAVETGGSTVVSIFTADGSFEFPHLAPGRYTVKAYKAGHWLLPDNPITLDNGARKQVNVFLYQR